ncbi:TetR family transcriptional regulator [Mycolicibacterium sp. S2-37]|uniref:TetR family transcriptional regulator n=1 Tax=Mycolicibacterium sp. S2-37 TaxID=2810297 RepID=UPI001A94D414|nr:TetR family transcriptional regulator [Mycolicibacterium sp. S2-37]MBO0677473.1 TetR family transcriptional regulator [Mycolicibacterium sp. S2-37]
MSSSDVAHVTLLRDSRSRRTRTCRRVFSAAVEMLDEPAGSDVSMPTLAARARLAPSAVTAEFSSVDAMFAELYLHRVSALPLDVDPAAGLAARVSAQLRAVTLVMADEPRLAAACSKALLRTDDDAVAAVRERIGAEVHRRVAAALGPGAWPEVLATLETVFWGALLQVQSRSVGYHEVANRLDTMLALILPGTEC